MKPEPDDKGSFDGPPLPDIGGPGEEHEAFLQGLYKEAGDIWNTLSQEDVSAYTKDRNGLSYLSWASAWGVMMKHYPGFEVEFDNVKYLPDDTATVRCRVQVLNTCRDMWLPVMDYRHNAIANPSSRDISDAKMRCMTKCLALFGLGHYIFDGEDLPPQMDKPEKKEPSVKKKSSKKKDNGAAPKEDAGPHVAVKELMFDEGILKSFKDISSLEEYYRKQKSSLEKIQKTNPETYKECLAALGNRKRQIQEGA